MNTITVYEGKLVVEKQQRVAIISSRFNGLLVESLETAAIDTLVRHGLDKDNIDIIRVPGAFEIPLAAKKVLSNSNYGGAIALGIVIRGATAHFDYVASNCASGCQNVSLQTERPIAFGVLTTENIEQAIERSGTKAGNKGVDAALALIEMLSLSTSLEKQYV